MRWSACAWSAERTATGASADGSLGLLDSLAARMSAAQAAAAPRPLARGDLPRPLGRQ
jgi:hypothetical protein